MAKTVRTLKFTQSSTQHVTDLEVYGSSGVVMPVVSSAPGTFYTIAKDGGGDFRNGDYLSIQDCHISGGSWYAGHNSTSVSGNLNIILADYFIQTLTDTVTLAETFIKSLQRAIASSITLSEVFSKVAGFVKNFTEAVSLSETMTKATEKKPVESVTTAENLKKDISIAKNDSVSIVEEFIKYIGKARAEVTTLIETFIKSMTVRFHEVINYSYLKKEDDFYLLSEDGYKLVLDTDVPVLPDTLEHLYGKPFFDSITLIEHFISPLIRKFPRVKKLLQIKVDNILLEVKRRVTMLK